MGDFQEWPRMDLNGLKLHGAIEALGETVETVEEKYKLVLDRMDTLLRDLDSYEVYSAGGIAQVSINHT